MDDRNLMQNLLLLEKGCCDLYMHGAIESSTQQVRQTFSAAFDDALSMGDSLYQQMTAKGWYQTDTAPEQKVQQTRQKFNPTC
jgi:spore coat protein CotF